MEIASVPMASVITHPLLEAPLFCGRPIGPRVKAFQADYRRVVAKRTDMGHSDVCVTEILYMTCEGKECLEEAMVWCSVLDGESATAGDRARFEQWLSECDKHSDTVMLLIAAESWASRRRKRKMH